MNKYNLVVENSESTVVSDYLPEYKRATTYQSEAELEKAFIHKLTTQAYEYVDIANENDLIGNLRGQLESLNNYQFTDNEWRHFFATKIANTNEDVADKTFKIQEDYTQLLDRDDGTTRNIHLIDKSHIHNNKLQVINQYEVDGARSNRYDVTILVNGLPLVHVELKRRGVLLQQAFNQIKRYERESFWAGSGLFDYIQLFVISNGTQTKYYSNTTRSQHINESKDKKQSKPNKTSNSFEFTSWWADANNKPIYELMDFAATFFSKHTLLNILTKYCVFTTDHLLLVMRPYQIVAAERILNRIEISTNYKKLGTLEAGGYIWHTTGSGKTLTSFKTAQLASKLPYIEKVLFVVDRKDLDYQTMKEYDKFAKGAANSSSNTNVLTEQLTKPNNATLASGQTNSPIVITTIQKLDKFIKKNLKHEAMDKHVVIIFDECHRSQFGDMHTAITSSFKNYHLFGFTGTPIFAKNSSSSGRADLRTTLQAFGCYAHGDPKNCPTGKDDLHQSAIHTYTIVNAINDKNVLPFRIAYMRTIKEADNVEDVKVRDINRERALAAPERISLVTKYILDNFNQQTKRNDRSYAYSQIANVHELATARDQKSVMEAKEKIRLSGFNSIFAVSSIDAAKLYYAEFKKQQADKPELARIKVATIFSYDANEPESELLVDENTENTDGLDKSSRDFLDGTIDDYNKMFKTNYDTSADKFQSYYKDVSLRMKNREVDILIVVNMFLTGFDATTLNTLWVDKNLYMHGLLQAYSRTNRILNSIKTFGNIITFRNLEKATNDSIALFGNKEARGIVLLKTFREYYEGYEADGKKIRGYAELVSELMSRFPVGVEIIGEQNQKDFISLYGAILRLRNVLTVYDDFTDKQVLNARDMQDYQSMYINFYEEFRKVSDGDKADINDDIVFEMELIKQVEINIDYILELIRKYHSSNLENKDLLVDIKKAVDSSVELRNKKDLIEQFIDTLNVGSAVDDDWQTFVNSKRSEELDKIIAEENLDRDETYRFVENAFRNGTVQTSGMAINKVLPPLPIFDRNQTHVKKRETVIDKIIAFFEKFFDISGDNLK